MSVLIRKVIAGVLSSLALSIAQNLSGAEPLPTTQLVEDFDGLWNDGAGRWQFSNGAEFPGATGGFERSKAAAKSGEWGGKLNFDFNGGGKYVAAALNAGAMPNARNVQAWIKKPPGVQLAFRVVDQSGQTLQRSLDVPDDKWTDVTIPLSDWAAHWGGANDGAIHDAVHEIIFIAMNTGPKSGSVLLDDVRATKLPPLDYVVATFSADEHWYTHGAGNIGATKLEGHKWNYDFSQGASSLSVSPPDTSLLGTPYEFHIRTRGNAEGHTVRLVLATHFMFFERAAGAFPKPDKDGFSELVVSAPPAAGWTWHDGENDGKFHGALRLREIRLEASGKADAGTLELVEVRALVACDRQHSCVFLADCASSDDGNATFRASVRSLYSEPIDATIDCTIRDWDKQVLHTERRKIRIPPRAETVSVEIKTPPGAQKFLEAEFSLAADGVSTAPALACYVAPLEKTGDNRIDPESPFGLGIYLERYGVDPAGLVEMEKTLQLAQDAGVKWSRQEFHWAFVEPERGKFDWSGFDKRVAAAKKHGIKIYGLLAYWSSWTQPYTQAGMDDFCRYAAAAAERYRDDIDHWEVYNEPNIFFWQGAKDLYPVLVKQVYAAIKRVNPSAQVMGCSTCGIDTDFIRMTVNAGAPLDGLTIHPYRQKLDDRGFISELQQAAAIVKRADGKTRPVWITEMGWSTYVQHNTIASDFPIMGERGQAAYLARVYIDALASGVTPNISWYDFRNDGDDPFDIEYNMGVVRRDFRPKPSYRAFAMLTQVLKDKHIEKELKLNDGVIAFRFAGTGGKDPLIALWSVSGDRRVSIPTSAKATVTDLMGNSRAVEPVNGNVQIQLQHETAVFLQE